jgi:hypothetical protein
VVADGEFARPPFLHDANDLGLSVVVRLKNPLPELFAAAQKRFGRQLPHQVFRQGKERFATVRRNVRARCRGLPLRTPFRSSSGFPPSRSPPG